MPTGGSIFQLNHDGGYVILGQKAAALPERRVVITPEDIKQLQDMFPNVEEQVIRTILETERGNKERAVNRLVQMNTD